MLPALSCSSTDSVISSSSRSAARPEAARAEITVFTRMLVARNWAGDRLTARRMWSGQRGRLAAGLAHHPLAERVDQAGLLGDRDEVGRRDHAAVGVVPAQQGLAARDPVGARAEQRLVVELELALGQGPAQVRLEGRAGLRASSMARSKKRKGAAAVGLGAVEGHVGLLQQLVAVGAVVGRHGHADAARRSPPGGPAGRRSGQGLDDAAPARPVGAGRSVRPHWTTRELVAAQAGDRSRPRARRPGGARRRLFSRASPIRWPRVSLTVLKRSRSMQCTATRSSRRAGARGGPPTGPSGTAGGWEDPSADHSGPGGRSGPRRTGARRCPPEMPSRYSAWPSGLGWRSFSVRSRRSSRPARHADLPRSPRTSPGRVTSASRDPL